MLKEKTGKTLYKKVNIFGKIVFIVFFIHVLFIFPKNVLPSVEERI